MRSFTVAPVAFPACTQQAFLLETVFDVLAKINTDAPVNPGHAYCLIRHSRRRSRPVQEAPPWPLNVFALVEHVSLPANHEQLKWTKDDCGSRIATYVTFIEDSRPYEFYLFIYFDYPSFLFFFFKWIRKVKFFFYRYRCIGFNLKVEFESYTLETTIFNGELFKVEFAFPFRLKKEYWCCYLISCDLKCIEDFP